jgi:hypothetical protein
LAPAAREENLYFAIDQALIYPKIDMIKEVIEKLQELKRCEAIIDWDSEVEVSQEEFNAADDRACDLQDEIMDALEEAGILVSAADSFGWFPHPDWEDRLAALGMSEEDNQLIFVYVKDMWEDSLTWLDDLYVDGIQRAIAAYKRRRPQRNFRKPDPEKCSIEEQGGRMWVVLRDGNGEMGRYVVKDNGQLSYVATEEAAA